MARTATPDLATARRIPNVWDAVAMLSVVGLLVAVAHVSPATFQPLDAPGATEVTLDPRHLPVYALRTTMRMFAALAASLLFTFTFAPLAAKSRRAGLVLVPLLDILQSVPILGFLSFTTAFFLGLFPGRVAGLEFAAIFAIFTSQAWNMAFSFYQSLTTLPGDLVEATRSFRLSAWQRFWRLEVPFAMPGLVWNMMLSMSGGWFFVVASEAITLGDSSWKLPGIGSYVAVALEHRDVRAVFFAILAMLVVILLYDQLLFRPLVAWSQKFRFETTAGATADDPWVLRLLRRTRVLRAIGGVFGRMLGAFQSLRVGAPASRARPAVRPSSRAGDAIFLVLIGLVVAAAVWRIVSFIAAAHVGLADLGEAVLLGLITLLRVVVLIALATLLWVPIGVWLGLRPAWSRRVQPLAQFLAAFPANLFFPIFVLLIVRFHAMPDIWLTPLMILGTQWYILFNVIAGASAFPGDLLEAANNFPRRRLALVAARDPARDLPLFRHRRHHRLGRLVERGHRRRGRLVGRHEAVRARPGRLHRARHRRGRLPAHRAGRGGDVGLCRAVQPRRLAADVHPGHAPAHPLRTPPMDASVETPLLQVSHCRQSYHKDSSADLLVLDDVNLALSSSEIVGLLGRSGSGKSTLLRIVSGLLRPTAGDVRWQGAPVTGPVPGVAMVFQSFALFPWLTVQQNVELGLEAQGVARAERESRAEDAIDLIGLGGYENAYPKELSGGMRQRVGLARALVVHPDLLLMDEPFSALDVLTAETLRTDLIDLWSEGKLPLRSILMVTHNIEEAVLMCDRILVFSSNPGRVAHEMRVPFRHPRNRLAPAFRQMVDDIYAVMTRRAPAPKPVVETAATPPVDTTFATALHPVSTNLLSGLLETLVAPPYYGRADLPALAGSLQLEADELLPMGESLAQLGFAVLEEGDLRITETGRTFAHADIDDRKGLFAVALRSNVPLIAAIRRTLDERWNHRASAVRFRDELEDHMSPDYAEDTLDTAINWGRYAELFTYDEERQQFSLDDEDEETHAPAAA